MEVSDFSALGSALSQMRVGDAVGVSVLKKALDIEKQNAAMLLEALPSPASNPPNLGQTIDVRA